MEKQGLFYPPDPASRKGVHHWRKHRHQRRRPALPQVRRHAGLCAGTGGGAGGWNGARFGGRTHKNKTGFELHRLFVGSEGLLGVVTEATLKLLPLPPYRACLAVGFASHGASHRARCTRFSRPDFCRRALEVADAFTLAAAYKRTGSERLRGCNAHLIVELDGQASPCAARSAMLAKIVAAASGRCSSRPGLGAAQCEEVWKIRREFSYALRDTGLTKLNEDIVVPRGRLRGFVPVRRAVAEEARHCRWRVSATPATATSTPTSWWISRQPGAKERSRAALDELFGQVLAWGGSITGEHGIGLAKQPWWTWRCRPRCGNCTGPSRRRWTQRGF